MTPILTAKEIAYSTPDGKLLQSSLNFSLSSGQLLLIRGPNGCGKSTLLKALLGEMEVDSGEIAWSVGTSKLQFIPQLENTEVHFPLTLRDVLNTSSHQVDWKKVEDIGLVDTSLLQSAWNTASGGERKRVLLTRSLLSEPQILVFDEPMNHLDSASRAAMIRVLRDFLSDKSESRCVVMVCHQGIKKAERENFNLIELDLGSGTEQTI